MISYLLPTRDRPDCLHQTLAALGRLEAGARRASGGGEVIVVDDASARPVVVGPALANGLAVRVIRLETRHGAAARNAGVEAARGKWVVMLDDDSQPLDAAVVDVIAEAPADVAAIGGEIFLPDGRHEDGGLPEVIVGCGAAVRREAFLSVGGYDRSFAYYAEEYDLCAKLIGAGHRIEHDFRFRVLHRKVAEGRDMNRILRNLVRNNGWVVQRYAPQSCREAALRDVVERYARIARREDAERGYREGLEALGATQEGQMRRPLSMDEWDRFTGAASVRSTVASGRLPAGARVAVVNEGKHAWVVRRVLAEMGGVAIVAEVEAEVLMIGTLSPGPMLDAQRRRVGEDRPVVMPWRPGHCEAQSAAAGGAGGEGRAL